MSNTIGIFPLVWKKPNVKFIHMKNGKQLINNDCPLSLFHMFGKLFNGVIFDNIYK